MVVEGMALPLPDCPAPHLVEYLFEVGPVVAGGMGPAPVGWRDIAAWQGCTGIELEPWQAKLLRSLSIEYLAMTQDAQKPDCPAPWIEDDGIEANRAAVAAKVTNQFRALIASRTKPTR